MKFKNKVVAGFGTALAVLIFIAALSYRTLIRSNDDVAWVEHTHVVLETLQSLRREVA
jgi:CHASE3 domain sensor protein